MNHKVRCAVMHTCSWICPLGLGVVPFGDPLLLFPFIICRSTGCLDKLWLILVATFDPGGALPSIRPLLTPLTITLGAGSAL